MKVLSIIIQPVLLVAVLLLVVTATTEGHQQQVAVIEQFPKDMVYTYMNATSYFPKNSSIVTFMFGLPMYGNFKGHDDNNIAISRNSGDGPPLTNEIGIESGLCNGNIETGLVVCNNLIQDFGENEGIAWPTA